MTATAPARCREQHGVDGAPAGVHHSRQSRIDMGMESSDAPAAAGCREEQNHHPGSARPMSVPEQIFDSAFDETTDRSDRVLRLGGMSTSRSIAGRMVDDLDVLLCRPA